MANNIMLKNYIFILFTLVMMTFSSMLLSQDRPALLVLGSAHFNNPGRDAINIEVDDVLSTRRQNELKEVIEQLVIFNPTHIAIEFSSEFQETLDERYNKYRNGEYELSRSESEQIGLRLAAILGHETVYAVDWNHSPPGDIEADYNWFNYAKNNGHEALITAIMDPNRTNEYFVALKDQTIGTWLNQLNHPDALRASHLVYFDIAKIGDGEKLIGANWVGTWYARNLKIFTRLVKLAESSEDRVLVIYGQGHAYLLRQFSRESAAFSLVNVNEVLRD